jgi:hypothetical protein
MSNISYYYLLISSNLVIIVDVYLTSPSTFRDNLHILTHNSGRPLGEDMKMDNYDDGMENYLP